MCRSEVEFADLREFSEVEAAVVSERAAELEAAVRQLQEEEGQLQARLQEATCHHQEALEEVSRRERGRSLGAQVASPAHKKIVR